MILNFNMHLKLKNTLGSMFGRFPRISQAEQGTWIRQFWSGLIIKASMSIRKKSHENKTENQVERNTNY